MLSLSLKAPTLETGWTRPSALCWNADSRAGIWKRPKSVEHLFVPESRKYANTYRIIPKGHTRQLKVPTCQVSANSSKWRILPWLVWFSGLSASLWTRRLLVRFPVRAHAWVVGQVPSWGRVRGNQLMYLSHIDVFLTLLPSFPSL